MAYVKEDFMVKGGIAALDPYRPAYYRAAWGWTPCPLPLVELAPMKGAKTLSAWLRVAARAFNTPATWAPSFGAHALIMLCPEGHSAGIKSAYADLPRPLRATAYAVYAVVAEIADSKDLRYPHTWYRAVADYLTRYGVAENQCKYTYTEFSEIIKGAASCSLNEGARALWGCA